MRYFIRHSLSPSVKLPFHSLMSKKTGTEKARKLMGFSNSISPSIGRFPFFCLALSRAGIHSRARFVELCRKPRTHRPRDGKLEARGRHSEQILKILNRNTGLMVELKRWIAQDAGESGQVLEESLTPQVSRGSGCRSPANRPIHL